MVEFAVAKHKVVCYVVNYAVKLCLLGKCAAARCLLLFFVLPVFFKTLGKFAWNA